MKNILILPALAVALSACTMNSQMKGNDMAMKPGDTMMKAYTLAKQPAGMALNSSGTVTPTSNGAVVMTDAKVMGLAPSTYYVAHYHVMGTKSAQPCASDGAPIGASKTVGQTDAAGMLTLKGSVALEDILAAKYFNIHTAADPEGTPADAGVSCTAIDISAMKMK